MKMKVGLSLEEITVQRIETLARGTSRDKSAIVDMAVELLASQDEFSDSKPPRNRKTKIAKNPSKIQGVSKGMAMPEAA